MSDMLRITGLTSGFDTENTVKQLINLEQTKVDQVEQKKQLYEWKREGFREVANKLRGLQSDYLDVLKPEDNFRSSSMFNLFEGGAEISGSSTSAVSISTTSDSLAGDYEINSITQLATKDTFVSTAAIKNNKIEGSTIADPTAISSGTLSFTVDGITKELSLAGSYADHNALVTALQSELDTAFGAGSVTASNNGSNALEFTMANGHSYSLTSNDTDLLSELGLVEGQSNKITTSHSLETAFGISTDMSFSINGEDFTFTKDDSIQKVMNTVSASGAGVTLNYDNFNDKFTLTATQEGTLNAVDMANTADTDSLFLNHFKIDLSNGSASHTAAVDAQFEVNGVTTTRSSNTFDLNGTRVTLNETYGGASPIDVNISTNTTDVKDKIVKFVEKYNETLDYINEQISAKRYYDYDPLTKAQREELSDEEVELWDERAKSGLLKNDNALKSIVAQMRQAMTAEIDGVGISLADMGIKSENYQSKGRLTIDETKLDAALKDRPNEVIELFTKDSTTVYTDFDNRSTRTSESGLAERLNDIIQDNIRITRDDNGQKGYLLEMAGSDDSEDINSTLAKKIAAMDSKANSLLEMLADKEEKYYKQFARMEEALAQMQNQASSFFSQMGF